MPLRLDKVGPWTEVKVEIVREYASGFAKIVKSRDYFKPIYMDGFAGAGEMLSKESGAVVAGTPLQVLDVVPPFDEYHFVELNPAKAANLRKLIGGRPDVSIYEGDSNSILLGDVLPRMTFGSYRKGLLFLDPYGLHVDWRVVEAAGKSKCVDALINVPVMDMNMNVLKHDTAGADPDQVRRMNRFWGDDSWRPACYDTQPRLFEDVVVKLGNEAPIEAYRKRLQDVAGFPYVSAPLEMRNEKNAIVYYLVGASQAEAGRRVFNGVFNKWRKKGVRLV